MSNFQQKHPVAIGVMTGVTMLVGGTEPSEAVVMPVEQPFFCSAQKSVTDAEVGLDNSDDFGGEPFQFNTCMSFDVAKFDTEGGTKTLTQVGFAVTSVSNSEGSRLLTTLSGSANEPTDDFGTLTFEANNDPTLSFSVPGIGNLTPASYSPTGSNNCEVSSPDAFCETTTNVQTDISPVFNGSSMDALILGLFQADGGGVFPATPSVDSLTGFFGLSPDPTACPDVVDICTMDASAAVEWDGLLTVTYTYDLVSRVPVPGTLPLLGLGLLGLGALTRVRQTR
jgi:hypothetical protein